MVSFSMRAESSASAREEPLRQIVGNGGFEGAIVAEKVRNHENPNYGLNAATGDYEDPVSRGVIDPTKVTRTALQNASSITALMLTTEALVVLVPGVPITLAPTSETPPSTRPLPWC